MRLIVGIVDERQGEGSTRPAPVVSLLPHAPELGYDAPVARRRIAWGLAHDPPAGQRDQEITQGKER